MEKEKSKLLNDVTIIILLGIAIIMMGYVVFLLSGDGTQCLRDPIQFFNDLNNGSCEAWCGIVVNP